jgi:hypothetical protein
MNENEKISSREFLLELEAADKYLFHGSEVSELKEFEPRQAYNEDEAGNKIEDGEPAVHATPFIDIATLMALINVKNCPDGFESGFRFEGRPIISTTTKSLEQLTENSRGYVYVFDRADFAPRTPSQWISYKQVQPLQIIEVGKRDIPVHIEIVDNTHKVF